MAFVDLRLSSTGIGNGSGRARVPLSRRRTAVSALASPPASSTSIGVVVTGSTRGVGLALARVFASEGDRVVICSRTPSGVTETEARLREELATTRTPGSIHGTVCDVTRPDDVEALARFAREKLGRVDLWVNNAGSVANKRRPLAELDAEDVREVVDTNLLGSLLCTREAIRMMEEQDPPGGHIFLMDGSGTIGNPTPGYAAYGATKRSMPQLAKSLAAETAKSPVGIHMASPGMVLTDLLLADATPQFRVFFNFLAEEPETVARDLVPRLKAVTGSGQYVRYLTIVRGLAQVAAGFLFGYRRDRYFDSNGSRIVRSPKDVFQENGVRVPFAK